MSLKGYLKDNYRQIIFFTAMTAIVNLILISSMDLNKSISDILYMNLLLFIMEGIFLAIGYGKRRDTYKDLIDALGKEDNLDSYIPKGDSLEEKLIGDIIEFKNKEKLVEIEKLKENLEEINDYIIKWIHEIKIPISICELIADKIEDEGQYDLSKQLREETERINFLVNQVLYISRASGYFEDFIVEEVNLGDPVKSVIKNNMNSFLAKKIEVEITGVDYNIFTDSKWSYYIIEQIISNACKYVDIHGRILIRGKETDESIVLTIKDNGIGIPPKDLGRIFNRGFTGDNGRKTKKSTGMGLYVSKKVAAKLNLDIDVSSKISSYTEFRLTFYKISDYFNVTKM